MSHGPATAAIETDAVVIGAGPVGLFQVFQLGLHELGAQLVDSLPAIGGQCIELYPDKPIYDIPALPFASASELIDRLVEQIEPFATPPHLNQQVDRVEPLADGRFDVETSAGTRFITKTVFIAGGVGSFQPRHLKVDGLAAYEGKQVFYGLDDAARLAGQRVLIVGDGDAALETAIALAESTSAQPAASVTLMHRRDEFKAAPAAVARMRELCAMGRMAFVAAQPIALRESGGRLSALQLATADDRTPWLELDAIVAFTGVSPKLGPVAQWGLNLERKQIVVDTERFETNTRGIFAVGDIVTYPGKRKLIVSGFHEATLAAFAAAAHVYGKPVPLEYTTTSPRLQRLLGAKS
ncbi:MAG TPA: NAD(P)/FAD-dependent oxidoreductase [Burkholderiaceae bacterium]|nr:NAD(P)/FAD-dependent oxidoreductase [Burkholderiaceae bacterium]